MHDTPLFRSALKSLNFDGPVCIVEHKDINNPNVAELEAQNVTILKNQGKSGADDAIELGINLLASNGCNFVFYVHSDFICPPNWFEKFCAIADNRNEIRQWNLRHDHYYFRDRESLKHIQQNELNYAQLLEICTRNGINNHRSLTKETPLELSKDFWGNHRTGRTAPLTGFYISAGLATLDEKPKATFALFDVALSLHITKTGGWKAYANIDEPGLHISGSGHDGFGADTGTIAHKTSALIEEDNRIFKQHYGFMPDDYLNFEYQEILGNHWEEITEALNSNTLDNYTDLLDLIKENFSA